MEGLARGPWPGGLGGYRSTYILTYLWTYGWTDKISPAFCPQQPPMDPISPHFWYVPKFEEVNDFSYFPTCRKLLVCFNFFCLNCTHHPCPVEVRKLPCRWGSGRLHCRQEKREMEVLDAIVRAESKSCMPLSMLKVSKFEHGTLKQNHIFLDGSSHLYIRVCPFFDRSICWSVHNQLSLISEFD